MNTKTLSALLCLLAAAVFGQQPAAYSDAEAAKHVGEEATVTGKLVTVSTSGKGTTFLNFGDRFPRHTFSGVIFARNEASVGDVKQYEGKEVTLSGRIELGPDQKPQIVLNDAKQISLASAAKPAAPAPPAPAPSATPAPSAAPAPTPMPERPAIEQAPRKATGRIALASTWKSSAQGGENVRKDLAKIFGDYGSASDTVDVDTTGEVYPGLPFLTPLAAAKKALHIDGISATKSKITTAGLPQGSLSAHVFSGVFPGGYDKLALVTDSSDQVMSVLVVDSGGRARVPNEPDTTGYHTYNFITGRSKAANDLYIKHQIVKDNVPAGVVVVDTLLVDPNDPEGPPPPRSSKGSKSSKSSFGSFSKPKTGKVLERARWYVPQPVVNLILRCVTR